MHARAVCVRAHGSQASLALEEVSLPAPGPGQARITIESAGVAYADIVMRLGHYPGVRAPYVPGYDCVGRVEALGPSVTEHSLKVGDRVAAIAVTGCWASARVLPVGWLVSVPEALAAERIVACLLNGLTAWQMMHRQARPESGEAILVHGGAGGVGLLLLDLARQAGLRTVATASASKHDLIVARAALPLDYRTVRFETRVADLTDGGVVAAFDPIGGRHLRRSFKCLRPGGMLISYGAYAATENGRTRAIRHLRERSGWRFDLLPLLAQGRSLATYNVNAWRDARPEVYRTDLSAVVEALQGGVLDPVVSDVVPLERAAYALDRLAKNRPAGKLVLKCD